MGKIEISFSVEYSWTGKLEFIDYITIIVWNEMEGRRDTSTFWRLHIGPNVKWPNDSNSNGRSVTRFGDLFDFGQLFKAYGNNSFAQISHIIRQFL